MLNFKDHFLELKMKLCYLFFSFLSTLVISYCFAPNLIVVLSYHFFSFVKKGESDFVFNNVFEIFSTHCLLSFYTSCFFNIPLVLFLLFTFVKSGLFRYEKKTLSFMLKFFVFLFFFSLLFSYFVVLPCLLFFFLNFDLITNTTFLFIKMEIKLYDFVYFVSRCLIFYCIFIFQIPSLILLSVFLKRPNPIFVVDKRKLVFFISLVVGCLFSSPDLVTLFAISAPFLLLFEVFLFFLILKNNYKYTTNKRVA